MRVSVFFQPARLGEGALITFVPCAEVGLVALTINIYSGSSTPVGICAEGGNTAAIYRNDFVPERYCTHTLHPQSRPAVMYHPPLLPAVQHR